MRRLVDRRLLKVLYSKSVTEIADLAIDTKAVGTIAGSLEAAVADLISSKIGMAVPKEFVIVKIRQSPQTMKSEGPVLVDCFSGRPETFESRSVIFRSIDQTLREEYLECYGPLELSDDRKRRSVTAALEELITQPRIPNRKRFRLRESPREWRRRIIRMGDRPVRLPPH
jgi:hypothetical protein